MYDPELPAGYQDADIEQREMERAGNLIGAWERQGFCHHSGAVGYLTPPVYQEQVGLKFGQLRCTAGCTTVFESDEDWYAAMDAVQYRGPVEGRDAKITVTPGTSPAVKS